MQSIRIEMHYYTYAYLREDKTPYYIGKGTGDRIYSTNRRVNPPKDKSRIIYLKQNLTEEEAFRHEIYMIDVFGRKDLGTGILYNMTNGGEGSSGWVPSEESRRKMSQSSKGKTHSKETRRKMGEAKKGNTYMLGKTLSEETRRKIGEASKGRDPSEETRRKISESKKNISEETRRKMSEASKGRTPSEESRRKMSQSSKDKTHSEETKRKIGDAGKGRKWWNDGCGNSKLVIECPGNEWKPGRK